MDNILETIQKSSQGLVTLVSLAIMCFGCLIALELIVILWVSFIGTMGSLWLATGMIIAILVYQHFWLFR